MDNKTFYIIICVLLIVIAVLLYKNVNTNDGNVNTENIENTSVTNNIEENTVSNNTVAAENVVENTVVNNTSSNTIQNAVVQDNLISSPEKNIYESDKDVGSTNKKQEAINLVKAYWGDDDTVSFTCDSVISKSEYVVAVISKNTASVCGYFRVNIDTKNVEVDY